ncbi:MAG: glycosyltransferase family 39 protein [Patescibacteria group bacterium]|nr:glycosyltransferase family 39 protein [Patescibacteria group bacterium]
MFAPYCFDEANTIYFVTQPFSRMLQFVMTGVEMPAYYVLLFGWIRVFAASPAATAVLSLILEVLAVILLYRLGRTLFSSRVARFGILLYLVSYSAIYSGTETRPYVLLLIATVSSLTALWHLLHGGPHGRWGWVEYLAASILGVYAHSAFLFLVYAQNVVVVWFIWRQRSALDFRRWIAAQLGMFVAVLPVLIPFALHTFERANQMAQTGMDAVAIPASGSYLERIVVGQFFGDTLTSNLQFGFSALLVMAIAGMLLRFRREPNGFGVSPRTPSPAESYLYILILIPFLTFLPGGFGIRHAMIILMPMFGMLLSAWFARWNPAWLGTFAASVFAAVVITFNGWYVFVIFPHEARFLWPNVAAYFARTGGIADSGPGLILLPDWDTERQFHSYYQGQLPVYRFFPTALQDPADPELSQIRNIRTPTVNAGNVGELSNIVSGYQTIWYVAGDTAYFYDPTEAMIGWMNQNCRFQGEAVFGSKTIRIRRYTACLPTVRR